SAHGNLLSRFLLDRMGNDSRRFPGAAHGTGQDRVERRHVAGQYPPPFRRFQTAFGSQARIQPPPGEVIVPVMFGLGMAGKEDLRHSIMANSSACNWITLSATF